MASLEYLKNVLLQFIFLRSGSERQALLPVIHTLLQLSPEEKSKLATIAQGASCTCSPTVPVIRCFPNCCFLTVFAVFILLLRGKHTAYIYILIQTPLSGVRFGCVFSEALCLLLLNYIQEGRDTVLCYSASLVRPHYCRLLH